MVEHWADNARCGKRVALTAMLALAGIAVVVMIGLGTFSWTSFDGRYVCDYCGLGRDLDSRSILGVTYHTRTTLGDTAISRVLNSRRKQKCRHGWYLIRWGRSSLRERADGGTRFYIVNMLIRDDDFARELAAMPNARQVWHAIMEAGDKSPKDMEALIGEWWLTGLDRQPFAQWWAANEARVRRLGSADRRKE